MIAIALAVLMQTATPQPCVKDGDTITGEFRYVESKHPNGTVLRHEFVVTNEPICVAATLGYPSVKIWGRWVDLFGSLAENRPQPGDAITVEVSDCFEAHTAWHLGDINCIHARLISREPM